MTDTTKPTGDTIDELDSELIAFGESITSHDVQQMWAIGRSITNRLAERPNRAVARGEETETVPVKLIWDAYQALGRHMEFWTVEDHDVADRLAALMTTPTETTDPAMEGA